METVKVNEKCIFRFPMPVLDESMYVIIDADEALIIDPNKNKEAVELLREKMIKKLLILLTHEHFDHISGVNSLREEFNCRVICSEEAARAVGNPDHNLAKYWEVLIMDKSPAEQAAALELKDEDYGCLADEYFAEAAEWQWHGHQIKAVSAPGHSKGSVLYFIDEMLFSGDSLVNGKGVICRLPGGKWKKYAEETLPLIQQMSDEMMVFPGHGAPNKLGNLRQYLRKA